MGTSRKVRGGARAALLLRALEAYATYLDAEAALAALRRAGWLVDVLLLERELVLALRSDLAAPSRPKSEACLDGNTKPYNGRSGASPMEGTLGI